MAAECLNGGGVVVPHPVMDAAHDRQFVGDTSQPRQVFAESHRGHAGCDVAEFTADDGWCVRLHVPSVMMTRPTGLKEQDARFDWRSSRRFRRLTRAGQVQTQQSDGTRTQQLAAGERTIFKTWWEFLTVHTVTCSDRSMTPDTLLGSYKNECVGTISHRSRYQPRDVRQLDTAMSQSRVGEMVRCPSGPKCDSAIVSRSPTE